MEPSNETQGHTQERPKIHLDRQSGSAASGTHSSCISSEAPDADEPDTDGGNDSDTGPAGLWNPHTGLKPLE